MTTHKPGAPADAKARATRNLVDRRAVLRGGTAALAAMGATAAMTASATPALAAGSMWNPIQYRSWDTRGGPKIARGEEGDFDLYTDLTGASRIPQIAVAVSYNLTVTQTEGAGFLSVWKAGTSWPGVSSINWKRSGEDIANGGIVPLGNGFVTIYCGGNAAAKTHLIVDITGYFL